MNRTQKIALAVALLVIGFVHLPALWGPWSVVNFPIRAGLWWSLILFAICYAALGNLRRMLVLCILFVPFTFFELGVIDRLLQQSSEQTYSFVAESNLGETVDAVGYPMLLGTPALLLLVLGLAVWSFRKLAPGFAPMRTRMRVLILVAAVPLLFMELSAQPKAQDLWGNTEINRAGFLFEGETHTALSVLAPSYPYGVPLRLAKFGIARSAIKKHADRLRDFKFGIEPVQGLPDDLTVVFFIGESSSRAQWELFGGPVGTNPKLKARQDLILMPDMIANWHATRMSVPLMLNRKKPEDLKVFLSEGSVLRAMSEAGFTTHWVSNQQVVGPHDSPISIIAYQADQRHFLNPSLFEADGKMDIELVYALEKIVAKPGKKFIVLHGLGSHAFYTSRYTPEFEYFKVDAAENNDLYIKNAYLNTIRYTDYVIDSAISALKAKTKHAAFLYVSDHGENLPNGYCQLIMHDVPSLQTMQVPSLLWFSDGYLAAFPLIPALAAQNASKRLDLSVLFDTVLSMAQISDSKLVWKDSPLREKFIEPERWVSTIDGTMKGFDGSDYRVNQCGVLVPKTLEND